MLEGACPAFHVGVEVYGVEWSFGANDDDQPGIFSVDPKLCGAHDYKRSIYMGDTTVSRRALARWFNMEETGDWQQKEYRQRDPLSGVWKTKQRQVLFVAGGGSAQPSAETEQEQAIGWWGDDYDLLQNNCCFFADYVTKSLLSRPVPRSLFGLAKAGGSLITGTYAVARAAEKTSTKLGLSKVSKRVGKVERAALNCCFPKECCTPTTDGQTRGKGGLVRSVSNMKQPGSTD